MNRTRPILLIAAATLSVALLAACSGMHPAPSSPRTSAGTSSASSGADTSPRNDADVMFSMMMVPHHAQAVEMADLVPSRSTDAPLVTLAAAIKGAQQPEIDLMTAWLKSWGLAPMTDMAGHMGHMGMDGMMTDEEMAELTGLTGAPFDRMWLDMMIRHHEGALDMAKLVREQGVHGPTRTLAESILESQTREIVQMKAMLAAD